MYEPCVYKRADIRLTLLYFADETKVLIAKHVLKTVCTDITNILVNFLAADLMMSVENPGTITNEVSRNS